MSRATSLRQPVQRAPRRIPLDNESITAAEIRGVAEARAAFARGEYYTLEEAKECVARLRSKARSQDPRPLSRKGR
jgi:hypothetical protein